MSEANPRPVCGFIGLGGQGAPMARRMIAAGFTTYLWARRQEALDPYREGAARFAGSVDELARQADHVGVCVVDDDDVRQVCGQLLPAMRPGGRIAIHSTIHPDTCRALAAEARERGLAIVDAPVSGGGPVAEAGGLVVMVGGEDADVAAARPVFETFGHVVVHLGPVGAGQQAKLINNTLFAANLGMAHDALAAAASLGMSQEAFAELIGASSGRSYGFDVRARMPPPARFRHAGELLAKDVRLLGEVMGADAPAFRPLRDSADQFLSYVLAAEG